VVHLPDPDWYLDNVLVHAEPGHYEPLPTGPVAAWSAWWSTLARSPDPLVVAAARQGFVLRADELIDLGISRQVARTAVRRGTWTAAARGFVAPFPPGDASWLATRRRQAVATAAAVASRPGHVASGRSAAVLHGLPTFAVPTMPELTRPDSTGPGRRDVAHVRSARLGPREITTWFGIPVTSVARTLVDLGRHDRRDAIMAVDAALREGLVSTRDIEVALGDARGWPGVRAARAVLAMADPRAESPLESLTRLVLHEDGFPPPELQQYIGDYRVDMLFRAQRLVLEIDGLEKYSEDEPRREKRRERRLRALDHRVERVTWDDVVVNWPETRRWLRAALSLPA
jgi:very-short-patch-repair endonuclease